MKEETLSYYIKKSKISDNSKFDKKIRVAILSSFTINGLENVLQVKCNEQKIECITYVAPYNQYNQEILESQSKLYQFNSDISFLFIDNRSILGDLYFLPYIISEEERRKFIQNKLTEIINLIKTFVANSKSKLIISNFFIPTFSSYGIYETKTEYSLQEMIYDLNTQLNNFVKNISSVYVYDFNNFIAKHGENNVFDYRQYFYGDIKISLNYLPYLATELLGYIKPQLGFSKKCIVLDLDNTLWGGIIGEDGLEGIKLGNDPIGRSYVEFQKHLLALQQRGILLAINSKNNFDDAMKVIRDHPNMILREKNFACYKINWNDKIVNLKEISEELNIGLDSMVFFDDDPVNREYIRINLPEIYIIDLPSDPSLYVPTLLTVNDFNVLQITEEDKKRSEMYLQQKQRQELQKNITNLQDFLKQLNISVQIKKADNYTIPRISQLTLKTNQFNLTTRRYQEEDIRKFSLDPNKIIGCAQVEDKFGDNGITGVFIINKDNKDEWTIDTFLLSCRIMGRGIEDGMFSYILQKAQREGVKKIKGNFIPTKKNKPAEEFLPSLGFTKKGDAWVYSIPKTIKIPDYLKIIEE